MTDEIKTGLRMYYLVPYNIMPIQKGIQSGHCAEQYAYEVISELIDKGQNRGIPPELIQWLDYAKNHKTWIILNGGTSNNSRDPEKRGSLNLLLDQLIEGNCTYSTFYEPDINDALTAICFLADEKVWDFENYPMYDEWADRIISERFERNDCSREAWIKFIGGKKNATLKEIIYKRPLAH